MDNENFDLDGKPAAEGMPNQKQMKIMIQKLLADRFQLKFHREKREMSAWVVQAGKNGPKDDQEPGRPCRVAGPGLSRPGALNAFNATMGDLASLLQTAVLDRPVVDQTGLDGHYDFALNWTPDETQFAGMGMKVPPPARCAARPHYRHARPTRPENWRSPRCRWKCWSLTSWRSRRRIEGPASRSAQTRCSRRQARWFGLRLAVTKVPVEVLVIDQLEKPSAN